MSPETPSFVSLIRDDLRTGRDNIIKRVVDIVQLHAGDKKIFVEANDARVLLADIDNGSSTYRLHINMSNDGSSSLTIMPIKNKSRELSRRVYEISSYPLKKGERQARLVGRGNSPLLLAAMLHSALIGAKRNDIKLIFDPPAYKFSSQ